MPELPCKARIADTAFIEGWDHDEFITLRGKEVTVLRQLNRTFKGDTAPRYEVQIDPPVTIMDSTMHEPWEVTTLNMDKSELVF